MAHLAQPLQTKVTLVLYFHRQFVELLHERARSVFLPVEDDSGLGHSSPVYSQSCETAIYCRCSPTTASASTPRSMWNCRSATSCGWVFSAAGMTPPHHERAVPVGDCRRVRRF